MTNSFFAAGALRAAFVGAILAVGWATAGNATGINVTTYHYDNYRTGWNPSETILTPTRVAHTGSGKTFQMLESVALDDQVDAQPLILSNQTIAGRGTHNVVYVVTENNSIYAIDADNGKILLKRNFGVPVPESELPGGCNNNAQNVGITSTPVIDAGNSTMYVMAYTYDNGTTPTYRLHALDPSSLADLVTPVVVTASGKLSNGKSYSFNAAVTRQRPALLLANGNVYAGFGSFCDAAGNESRGWVLGWQSGTLTPLASNELVNKFASSPDDFFLSSVWMAGYGLASGGPNGDVYFVTGNTDSGSKIPDGRVDNLAESVVQISPDLSTVVSVFTPDDYNSLDQGDTDFGSGGALLLPPQAGQAFDLLVAGGKDGNMYFLNGDSLDNNTTGAKRILGTYNIGGCWCGESYFTGSDGVGRIVSSGGYSMEVWKVLIGSKTRLVQEPGTGNMTSGSQDPGFFTTVSTNGTTANTGIVWALSRADGTANENIALFAFNATTGATLFSANAGTWPNVTGDADLVPVVANGKVYVASYQGLTIFGLGNGPGASVKTPFAPYVAVRPPLAAGQHEIYGMVHAIDGATIVVEKRDGTFITVDTTPALKAHDLAPLSVGHGVLARGTYNAAGAMAASVVLHAKDHTTAWLPDR